MYIFISGQIRIVNHRLCAIVSSSYRHRDFVRVLGDRTMPVNLTPNAIAAIVAGDVNSKPLVQVLDIKLISNNTQQERYRLLLSDSVNTQHAMLANQLNDRVRTGRVKKGSVVQLIEYICSPIQNRKSVFHSCI